MDSPPTPQDAQSAPVPRRSRTLLWLSLFALALVVIMAAVLILTPAANENLTWLSPADAAGAGKPGAFTKFKRKAIGLTAPLWRWYHRRPRASITISANILTLSPTAATKVGLGSPAATNQDGSRAWILSAQEVHDFQQRLKTNSGAAFLSSPRVQSAEGMQATMQMGNVVPIPGGKFQMIGLTLNTTASLAPGAVKLTLGATSTEMAPTSNASYTRLSAGAYYPGGNASPASSTSLSITTNFAVACRVLVPQNGGLVINAPPPGAHNTNDYWIILSPTALDPTGRPIK